MALALRQLSPGPTSNGSIRKGRSESGAVTGRRPSRAPRCPRLDPPYRSHCVPSCRSLPAVPRVLAASSAHLEPIRRPLTDPGPGPQAREAPNRSSSGTAARLALTRTCSQHERARGSSRGGAAAAAAEREQPRRGHVATWTRRRLHRGAPAPPTRCRRLPPPPPPTSPNPTLPLCSPTDAAYIPPHTSLLL